MAGALPRPCRAPAAPGNLPWEDEQQGSRNEESRLLADGTEGGTPKRRSSEGVCGAPRKGGRDLVAPTRIERPAAGRPLARPATQRRRFPFTTVRHCARIDA